MANGLVRIVMQVTGLSGVRAAMRGVVAENRRAEDIIRRATTETERARQRSQRSTVDAARRGARDRVTAELSAEQQISREQQRSSRARERDMRRRLRAARGGDDDSGLGAFRGAAGISGAAGGAAMSAISQALSAVVQRLTSVTDAVERRAGVEDVGTRTASGQDFELQLARSSGEFFQGQDPEQMRAAMAGLRTEIAGVAVEAGQSPNDLLNVLSMMQSEFSQFEEGRANLRAIALEAQRTGTDMGQLARFIGVLNHQLGETAPTAERAFDIMAQQGLAGAITPGQLATDFAGMFGQFRDISGLQGEDALRQFGALANALKTKDMSSAETATLMQNLFTSLGNTPTRDRLREATGGRRQGRGPNATWTGGTQAFRADGTVDVMGLLQDSRAVEAIGTSDVVFHDSQARQALGQLVSLEARNAAGEDVMTAGELAAVDADAGRAYRTSNLATVMGTGAMESRRIAVQGQIEGIENLSGREEGANKASAFREAALQMGSPLEWLGSTGATLLSGAGSWLAEKTTAEQRDWMMTGGAGLVSTGIGAIPGAALIGAAELGDVGAQANQSRASARSEVSLADGSRVDLSDASMDRLASRIATAVKGGVSQDGRTSGEPRR